MIAIALAAWPFLRAVQGLRSAVPILKTSTHVAAVIGAFPAAYALRNFRRETSSSLLFCLLTAGGIGLTMMAAGAVTSGNLAHRTLIERLKIGVDSLLLRMPLVFVFEHNVLKLEQIPRSYSTPPRRIRRARSIALGKPKTPNFL
jgi:hypothetical protein